jgi:hypothetical protein
MVDSNGPICYNNSIMKQRKKTLPTSPQPRAHRMLFDKNLPFGPKKEQNLMLYKRHTKHRAQDLLG